MSATPTRTVVLGNTGFVGGRIHEALLARGAEVHGYGSADLDLRAPNAEARLAAVIDDGPLLIVASALTPPRGATLDGFTDNLAILRTVAGALGRAHPAGCVYLSSDGVYGFDAARVDERTPVAPEGWYPVAKYTGELMLQTAAAVHAVPLLTIRPAAIFGPGDTHRAYGPNRFVQSVAEERVVRLFGSGEEIRDHVFIDDVVDAVLRLVDTGASGVYGVASGTPRTFASIVDDLRELSPVPFEIVHERRHQPVAHRSHDIRRLRSALPDLRLTPFADALAATLEAALRPNAPVPHA